MRKAWIAAALVAWAGAARAGAAQTLDAPDTAAHRSPRLFTRHDLYVAGAFAAAAVVMAPLDRSLAHALQDSSVQANGLLSSSAKGVRLLASPGSLIISGGMFAAGRVFRSRPVADAGLHTFESVVMAEALTGAVKEVAGRSRPSANSRHPLDYRLGGGFSGGDERKSMPSGHAAAAFAAAAAGASEVGEWWPSHRTLAAATLYTAAGLVGASRMYNNKHWASDVVVGAGIGAFSGWKVVGYTHAHPGNPIDRLLLRTRVAPAANGGVALTWSSRD